MKASTDRILTTHVGSLPRSEPVVAALDARENGAAAESPEFDATIRQAVADVVRRQVDIGIDIVSDGESSKISYATYVKDRLTGFAEEGPTESAKPHLDLQPFPALRQKLAALNGTRRFKRVACIGPVAVRSLDLLRKDFDNMRSAQDASAPLEAFVNAASPGVIASFLPNHYYPSHETYIAAIADAMRQEYQAVVGAGFLLQIDCPDLAMSRHTAFQNLSEIEFLQRAAFHVDVLNRALAGIPSERVRVHVCWGNYEGPHTHDIDLSKIIGIVLGVNAQALSIEAANPRHEQEWALWRDVKLPGDKILLPGVIDTSTNYVEHPELVAQRIVRFAEVVGRERVIASTDCGFGTSAGYGKIDPQVAYLKLGALVAGADLASRRLWK